jgi:hypothetical protein
MLLVVRDGRLLVFKGWLDDFQGTDFKRAFLGLVSVFQGSGFGSSGLDLVLVFFRINWILIEQK